MALPLTIDHRFVDPVTNLGVVVDGDLSLQVWEIGRTSAKVTRVIGTDASTTIVQSSDSAGVFYSTVVDVSDFIANTITAKWFAKSGGFQLSPYPAVETFSYPTPPALSAATLESYVQLKLGSPLNTVELTSGQVNVAVGDTLRRYNRHCPREIPGNLTLLANVNAYLVPAAAGRGVFDVQFVRKLPDTLFTSPYFGREFPRLGTMPFDEFVLGRTHLESVRRVTSSDPDWRWEFTDGKLYVTNGNFDGWVDPTQWIVTFKYYQDLSVEQIPLHHHDWFYRHTLATCQLLLAEVRGKYSGKVPSPDGGMTLNSGELRQAADAELAKLDEDIRAMAIAVPAIRG